jgi:hypothetical protein
MKCRLLAFLLAVSIAVPPSIYADTCSVTGPNWPATPLTDFQTGEKYLGAFPGFLYAGQNDPPADHDSDGRTFAGRIHPINGKVVFLSIGFSNNTIEFCGASSFYGDNDDPAATPCNNNVAAPLRFLQCSGTGCPYNQVESFMGQAFTDASGVIRQDGTIVLVDGAKGAQVLACWDPNAPKTGLNCDSNPNNYDRVKQILTNSGLTEDQVQSIWLKDSNARPTDFGYTSLDPNNPFDPNADANIAEVRLGDIVRYLHQRYRNLQQVFISPRTYGGYANLPGSANHLNPEPFAYEIGFSIKHLIQAQIDQHRNLHSNDPFAGALNYNLDPTMASDAPWIAWGPYLWADGTNPRHDGVTWPNTYLRYHYEPPDNSVNECTHPSTFGEQKVGQLLLDFMKQSIYTAWFRVPPL